MPSSLTCSDDAELLAVASGESMPEELRAHLADCSTCRERLERFRAELALLRARPPEAPLAPSTAGQPSSDAAAANGGADDSHATTAWQGAEASKMQASEPGTEVGLSCDPGGTREADLPTAIGKYLVIGRFPPTGQAEVFRVVHPGLAKELVLKLSLEPASPDGRCEIIDEGRVVAQLDHPNLVRVYDSDFHNDRPYLVMEYIRGRTLDQVAREGRLQPRRAASLLAKVAGAADCAHRQGVFHRDIKPKNILIDESGEPRLIDFGMARLRHAYSDDPVRPGGTFAYMAPEQARVESPEEQQKVGPRSDVFALGAVLYQLLTGRAPFPGQDWRESMDRARRCDFDVKALDDPKVPRDLRRICLKAMSADPEGRYPSAEALRKALLRYLGGPKIRAVAAGLAGLAVLGPLFVGAKLLFDSSRVEGAEAIALQVTRGTSLYADYQKALPLLTGDRLKIRCAIPSGTHPVVFWVDSEGGVKELAPIALRQDEGGNHVVYPEQGVVPVEGPPGTELVVVCANRWGQTLPVEAAAALADLGRLPELPENVRFQISRQGTRVLADRGLGALESDQLDVIKGRIERLRIRLLNQFDLVEGLVISHQDAH